MNIDYHIFKNYESFHDNVDELNCLGYTILDGIGTDLLKQLKRETSIFIKETQKQQKNNGELYNLINSKTELRKKSNTIVDQFLTPWVESMFNMDNVDFYPVSHIVKPFGLRSDIWHQDAAIVDEQENFSLNVWMPLANSHYLNGCIWIIPGSHIFDNPHRVFGNGAITKDILKGISMKPVFLKKGQVLLFHRNTIHGSSSNYLPYNRIAIEGVLMNKNAKFIKYFQTEEQNILQRYHVGKELFLNDNPKKFVQENELPFDIIHQKDKAQIIADFYNNLSKFKDHSKKL